MFSVVCVVLGGREKGWGERGLWKDCRERVLSLESFSIILNYNYSDKISDYVCCEKISPLFIAGLLLWAEEFTTKVLDAKQLCQWEANRMRGIVSDLGDTHVICEISFFLKISSPCK